VDSEPNVTTPPAGLNQLSQSHYFGVFVVGGTSPTYKLTYNYNGHPGISNENNLELASRSNNATTSWIDLDATLDTGANTLIKTDQTGTEYILSSTSDNTLPVELSSFFAQFIGSLPILCWTTQSETSNAGWNVYRGETSEALSNEEAYLLNLSLGLIPVQVQHQNQQITVLRISFLYIRGTLISIGWKVWIIPVSLKSMDRYL